MNLQDPRNQYPQPPYQSQQQQTLGTTGAMQPRLPHGEQTNRGSGKLQGRRALITGGDSRIGGAVAIAFACEGADIAICYLNEETDTEVTVRYVEAEGSRCLPIAGDIWQQQHCRQRFSEVIGGFGGLEILVNNAAFSQERTSLQEVSSQEWDKTFKTNVLMVQQYRLPAVCQPYN